MIKDERILLVFNRVYKKEMSLAQFEEWLYANNQLESVHPELYDCLIDINYQRKDAFWKLQGAILPFIDPAEPEHLRITGMLNSLINTEDDYQTVMSSIYKEYCAGYTFLRYLGLCFIASTVDNPNDHELILKNLIKQQHCLKQEAKRLLHFLENSQIKITGEHQYKDFRKEQDKSEMNEISISLD